MAQEEHEAVAHQRPEGQLHAHQHGEIELGQPRSHHHRDEEHPEFTGRIGEGAQVIQAVDLRAQQQPAQRAGQQGGGEAAFPHGLVGIPPPPAYLVALAAHDGIRRARQLGGAEHPNGHAQQQKHRRGIGQRQLHRHEEQGQPRQRQQPGLEKFTAVPVDQLDHPQQPPLLGRLLIGEQLGRFFFLSHKDPPTAWRSRCTWNMPRYWVGVQPFIFLKVRLKVETLEKPDCSAI